MRRFTRTVEDFTCQNCGARITGDGYTNHCPRCLYSKHVDVNPGDRASECGGLMEPVGLDIRKAEPIIVHRCLKCHTTKRCRSHPDDEYELLCQLSANPPRSSK